jgi:hypothetical protein
VNCVSNPVPVVLDDDERPGSAAVSVSTGALENVQALTTNNVVIVMNHAPHVREQVWWVVRSVSTCTRGMAIVSCSRVERTGPFVSMALAEAAHSREPKIPTRNPDAWPPECIDPSLQWTEDGAGRVGVGYRRGNEGKNPMVRRRRGVRRAAERSGGKARTDGYR